MPALKSVDFVVTNMRIRTPLRDALVRAAEKNGVSLNAEVVRRLADSFENADALDLHARLHALKEDLELGWLRYGERFLVRELEEGILTALEQRDYELARKHAIALRKTQTEAARQREAKMRRDEE